MAKFSLEQERELLPETLSRIYAELEELKAKAEAETPKPWAVADFQHGLDVFRENLRKVERLCEMQSISPSEMGISEDEMARYRRWM